MRLFNMTRLNPLGLAAFGDGEKARTDPVVVFFGDSRASLWPAPARPGTTFINRGIDGHTSEQCLLRFDRHVTPLAPDVVILQVGINDLVAIASLPQERDELVDETSANIVEIAQRARALGAIVIVTTIFPPGRIPLAYRPFWSDEIEAAVVAVNEQVRGMAGEGIVMFDTTPVLAASDGHVRPQYAADALHVNRAGYDALNEALIPLIQAQLAR
jgi:lysophospholipase L1-like esterase